MANGKYQIWISWDGEKQKLQLPALPEKIDVKCGVKNDSVDVILYNKT